MIRVLEVNYGFGYGGIRACIQNYVSHIDKGEFQVDLFIFGASESPFQSQMEEMGCNMYFDPVNYIAENRIIDFVRVLTKFIRNGHYDVVHAHCNLTSAWVTLAAKMAGAKVRISHSHSAAHLGKSKVQNLWCYLRRWIINRTATHKMACGQLAGEAMYGKRAKFTILQNGIDLPRFIKSDEGKVSELRKSFNIPEGVKIYANVTRMDPPKNHIFAIEVFNEIHKLDPEAIFIYGGVDPAVHSTLQSVKKKISEYNLDEFVKYSGPIRDVENLYHLSDMWIYCSAFEGLPFGPIELQAASVPCLASDVITNEIDLGLGLVKFLSLDASYSQWAKVAVETTKRQVPTEKIEEAFRKYRFDINQNVKMLESVYKG